MKKKNFFTGSVFQFYVPEINKYAFCKFFDFRHISAFQGLLAKVFDKFSDTEQNSLSDLNEADWLFGARNMHKWPNLQKDTGWKYLGVLNSAADDVIPDFKGTNSSLVPDDSVIKNWFVIRNLTNYEACEYEQVKHLERAILTTSSLGLVWRTGMEYCRINNLPISDYYDLEEIGCRNMYWQTTNTPIYCDIPEYLRGKFIERL